MDRFGTGRALFYPEPTTVVAPPSGATAFDPGKTGPGLVLSGGNLTATRPGGTAFDGGSLSTTGYLWGTSTKVYFEVTYTIGSIPSFLSVGLVDAIPASWYLLYDGSGAVYVNAGSVHATIQTMAEDDVTAVAIDFGTNKIWFKNITAVSGWNNDILANQNPATGDGGINMSVGGAPTGSTLYAFVDIPITLNSVTAAFTTGFVGTIPSGYTGF